MRRQKWRFNFEATELRKQAQSRAENHARHVEHWQKSHDSLDAEMQKTARIEEQPVTGGVNRVVRYDPGLQQLVGEANSRLQSHQRKQREYEDWELALSPAHGSSTPRNYGLDHEDVAFFFAPMESLPSAGSTTPPAQTEHYHGGPVRGDTPS